MVRKFLLLVSCLPLFLHSEEDYSNKSYWDFHPIHSGGNAILLGNADVEIRDSHQGELSFNKENAFLYMLLPISKTSYFFPRVEWNTFGLDWNKNPKFNETRFSYVQFALTFYTTAIENWRWILRGDYNFDTKHFTQPGQYGLGSVLVWGSYKMHRKWHYHVGFLGFAGLKGENVYPVIGLDYAPNKKWLFQAIFPMSYSIEYTPAERWRISLKGRPLKERFRTGSDEPQPKSIFNYSSMGAELNFHYEIFLRLELEWYAGYNFGGNFYIKDKTGHHPLYTHVQGSPYGGLNLNFGF